MSSHGKKQSQLKKKQGSNNRPDEDIQLTNPEDFSSDKLIFSDPQGGSIDTNKGPPITFNRVFIKYEYPNGKIGPLIIGGERYYSFGVSENTDATSGNVTGHSMSLNLIGKDGATDEQQKVVNIIKEVYEKSKVYLVSIKKKLKKTKLTENNIDGSFNCPLYIKDEDDDGNIIDNPSVRLYPKLIESKKKGLVITRFIDEDTEEDISNPLEYVDVPCFVTPALKIESIFVGSRISMQIKLWEAYIKKAGSGGVKRLLTKPKIVAGSSNPEDIMGVGNDNDKEDSESGSDLEFE